LSNKTILFADDSVTMRTILEKTFFAEPYDVTTVPSGEAAIIKARELHPDIIIADAGMAGVSGYDVCKAVREDSSLSSTPFIIMAGVSNPYDESRGAEVGVDEYIKKPFDTSQLIEKVGELASRPSQAKAPAVPSPQRIEVKPPVPQFTRSLTEKPAVAPAGPRPIATPIAAKTPSKEAIDLDSRASDSETPEPLEIDSSASFEEVENEAPEAEPIELREEAEPGSFQVSTLAELAQMDERGSQIIPEAREDAIDLPETPLIKLGTPGPIADALEPPMEPSGISQVPTLLREKTGAAVKSIGKKFEGLNDEQLEAIVGLTAEVVERVVWEVVPDLAEAIIKEELTKLLRE
jgi:CheY-like chemotaxis protein